MFNIFTNSVFNQLGKMEKQLGNSSRKKDYLGIMCLIIYFYRLLKLIFKILLFQCCTEVELKGQNEAKL